MPGLLVNLGWDQAFEADPSALPAILGVCRDLNIPVNWQETEGTLYISAPTHGRKIVLAAGANGHDVAVKISEGLCSRLTAAGADASVSWTRGPLPMHVELLLRIEIASLPVRGVSARFSRAGWRLNEKLANLLTCELSSFLKCNDLGSHILSTGSSHEVVPSIVIGLPDPGGSPDEYVRRCIDALTQGLTAFWTNSLLEIEAQAEEAPDLLPPEEMPRFIHDPFEEPRMLLGPETIVARRQEPLDPPLYGPVRRVRTRRKSAPKAKEPPPEVAVDPPAEAAEPQSETPPEPVQPVPAEPARLANSTLHTFHWSSSVAARPPERPTPAPVANNSFSFVLFPQVKAEKNHPR